MYRKDHTLSVNVKNGWKERVNNMYWDEDKSNLPAKKTMSQMGC